MDVEIRIVDETFALGENDGVIISRAEERYVATGFVKQRNAARFFNPPAFADYPSAQGAATGWAFAHGLRWIFVTRSAAPAQRRG